MEHTLAKTILITKVVEIIAEEYLMSIHEARNLFYKSDIIDLVDDDETGLYGESPQYVFSLFRERMKD